MSTAAFDDASESAGFCPVCGDDLDWAPSWAGEHVAIVATCPDHGVIDQWDALH
jgi:hypothetical protein